MSRLLSRTNSCRCRDRIPTFAQNPVVTFFHPSLTRLHGTRAIYIDDRYYFTPHTRATGTPRICVIGSLWSPLLTWQSVQDYVTWPCPIEDSGLLSLTTVESLLGRARGLWWSDGDSRIEVYFINGYFHPPAGGWTDRIHQVILQQVGDTTI